jgi:hypothetical protein
VTIRNIALIIATILGSATVYLYLGMLKLISYPIWVQEHVGYVRMSHIGALFPIYTIIFLIIADSRRK